MKRDIPIEVEEMIAGESLAWNELVKWDNPGQQGIALVAYSTGARMMYRKMRDASAIAGSSPEAVSDEDYSGERGPRNEGYAQTKAPELP